MNYIELVSIYNYLRSHHNSMKSYEVGSCSESLKSAGCRKVAASLIGCKLDSYVKTVFMNHAKKVTVNPFCSL